MDNLQMRPPPTGEKIFSTALSTLGKPEQLQALQSISGIADCLSPKGPYLTELSAARGRRLFFKQVHDQRPPFIAIINGSSAWQVEPHTQQPIALNEQYVAVILSHDFLMLPFVLSERFTPTGKVDHRDFAQTACVEVTALDLWGKPCQLYFATDTQRWRGLVQANPAGATGETVEIIFASWKELNGIWLPHQVSITDKSGEFQFAFRDLALNPSNEALFNIPTAIQAQN